MLVATHLKGDTFPNVGAECAAGVAGIVGALGEVAASGTLAMTSCKEYPMAGKGARAQCTPLKMEINGWRFGSDHFAPFSMGDLFVGSSR